MQLVRTYIFLILSLAATSPTLSAAYLYTPALDAAYLPLNNTSFSSFLLPDRMLFDRGNGIIDVDFHYRDTISSAGGGSDIFGFLQISGDSVTEWNLTLHSYSRYGGILQKTRFGQSGFLESFALEEGNCCGPITEGPALSGSPGTWAKVPNPVPLPSSLLLISSALVLLARSKESCTPQSH